MFFLMSHERINLTGDQLPATQPQPNIHTPTHRDLEWHLPCAHNLLYEVDQRDAALEGLLAKIDVLHVDDAAVQRGLGGQCGGEAMDMGCSASGDRLQDEVGMQPLGFSGT